MKRKSGLTLVIILVFALAIGAQTPVFTYQGSLNDGATGANGTYQMRFSLFNVQSGGNPISSSIEITNVQVANGIFSVDLDFGAAAFDGSNRFLQVEVRRNSGETYVPLAPRQQIQSVPYAVRAATSGNADQLGGVSSSQYVTSSSNAFITNGTNQQTGNFSISGNGTADTFNALSGYNIGGSRFLSVSGANTFVGLSAGQSWTTGTANTFIGQFAGQNHTTGFQNTFVGINSGFRSISGSDNTFIGSSAGIENRTGNLNTFIGRRSGYGNQTGSNNTALGTLADLNDNLNFATAIGAGSLVSTSNTIQLGRSSDRTNVSGVFNVLNGRALPVERGDVNLMTNFGNFDLYMQGGGNGNGINLAVASPATGNATFIIAQYDGVTYQDRLIVKQSGAVEIRQLGSAGSTNLCRNASNEISTCSSSVRYKSNVANFSNGLDIVKKLRPVSFNWTDGGMLDIGLVAEEVAEVEPLLTTQNEKGETEGVKYDRVGVVLVNAVKEQQKQIEDQQTEIKKQEEIIKRQQAEIELLKNRQNEFAALKALVCSANREAELCRTEDRAATENPESAVKENK